MSPRPDRSACRGMPSWATRGFEPPTWHQDVRRAGRRSAVAGCACRSRRRSRCTARV
jgi:hypothetical protein